MGKGREMGGKKWNKARAKTSGRERKRRVGRLMKKKKGRQDG